MFWIAGHRFKSRRITGKSLHRDLMLAVLNQVYLSSVQIGLIRVDDSPPPFREQKVHTVALDHYAKCTWTS